MVLLVDAFWNAPSAFWSVLSVFRQQRKLGKGFDAPVGPDNMQELEVMLAGSMHKRTPTKIYWDLTGQHTVSWKEPITILIDGVDIASLPLATLRSRLAIIPQARDLAQPRTCVALLVT